MRSEVELTVAVLLATLKVILTNPDVKTNILARNAETEMVLTDQEKMLMQEETFLEKLFLKISPSKNLKAFDGEKSMLELKSFLRTFKQTPSLQRRGKTIFVIM